MSQLDCVRENAFHVLGLPPTAARPELERAAARLLAELSLGRASALCYPSPLGPQPRTAERVRAALAELHDPLRRRVHAYWAALPTLDAVQAPAAPWLSFQAMLQLLGLRDG